MARAGLRARRRGAARRVDAAARGVRRVSARRRLRDPPRDRLPEHGLRAPAVSGRAQGRDVRLGARATRPRSASRRTPRSSSSTRRARRRSARSSSRCGASADDARKRDRPDARGAVHVPDDEAEDRRHRRGGREVRHGAGDRARSRRARSSPPAARSPPRRKKPKGSPTERVRDYETSDCSVQIGALCSSPRSSARRAPRITPRPVSSCASILPPRRSRSPTTRFPATWTRWRCRSISRVGARRRR